MDFIKKNYEKVLLGLVLAGLIGVLIFMFFYINTDEQAMIERANGIISNPSAKALPDLDLTPESNTVLRTQSPYVLDFDKNNKLFNTMEWQKTPDGTLIKISNGNEVGPMAVVVTNIQPLYLILKLDSVTTNELGARYAIGVERQADKNPSRRGSQQRFVSVAGDKNDVFSLTAIKGAPENPDALVVKLVDSGDSVEISAAKPYQQVVGYMADFRYDPEKKSFRGRRVGDKVSFGGIEYMVVDVGPNTLVLSDQSNQRKYSLPFAP